ncbi:transposase [Acetobacter senegalensis]|uniref:Transposase n=2 Tax=Acetobacter TaxID=434 RepID=A0A252EEL9_9PROT|nr:MULTISPECIES: transposase [Acetobacter]ATJ92820.1 IS5/IS1182 family transposase [Acetobacter tropicalis]MCP1197723.1 transposase [Acetobacter senegalensis]OUL64634.1 transposase [Acetobacter senegalensis]
MKQPGFFDSDDRLKALSAKGDALEKLSRLVDFERFRPLLVQAIPRSDGSKGGRPAYDPVFMFKVLVLQASHSLYEATLREAGFLAMSGQIIDATVVAAPRHRNTDAEKAILKAGEIPQDWKDKPKKLSQKDRDARWTIKYSKAKPAEDGAKRVDFAVPAFGYKNHVGIDRRYGLIRKWKATDASRHDGAQLPALLDRNNTASDVWADTAYRSQANEAHLEEKGLRSQIHRKRKASKALPRHIARANGRKSKVRSRVEHVFAYEKGPMAFIIRTIGLARATVKIGMANLVYNMNRAFWLHKQYGSIV